jgi:hypothetical protein
MSGLDANASKSSIFFDGIGEDTKLSCLQLTGFSEDQFPFKYLGVPLSPHRLFGQPLFSSPTKA